MPRGVRHDDAVRAAVIAALLAGGSLRQVAREHGVSRATALGWRNAAGLGSTYAEPEKIDRVGALVGDVLESALETLRLLTDTVAADPAWIRRQNAGDLAVFYGVVHDKSIRILEALEAAAVTRAELDAARASNAEDDDVSPMAIARRARQWED